MAALAAATLGGCGVSIPEVPDLEPGEHWVIGLSHPRGDWAGCFADEAVHQSLSTMDLPTSSASAQLAPEAERADVDRVLSCLDHALTRGEVSIHATRRPLMEVRS